MVVMWLQQPLNVCTVGRQQDRAADRTEAVRSRVHSSVRSAVCASQHVHCTNCSGCKPQTGSSTCTAAECEAAESLKSSDLRFGALELMQSRLFQVLFSLSPLLLVKPPLLLLPFFLSSVVQDQRRCVGPLQRHDRGVFPSC